VLRIALTGGIATGKSYVTRGLREAGVPVVDADAIAREVVGPGTPALAAIVTRFGGDILRPEGVLDRARLAQVVFRDESARRDLEAIVHPEVRQRIEEFFEELPTSTAFAVADIPLLYETGRAKDFDRVVVAAASPQTQVTRVLARGLSREEAEHRVAAQLPIGFKVAKADHVIRTDGTYAETDRQIAALLTKLRGTVPTVRE
jgi:dephospho-CoA kinase